MLQIWDLVKILQHLILPLFASVKLFSRWDTINVMVFTVKFQKLAIHLGTGLGEEVLESNEPGIGEEVTGIFGDTDEVAMVLENAGAASPPMDKANVDRITLGIDRGGVDSDKQILVVEDSKIANLTAAPNPADEGKTYVANGASAKAGLNQGSLQAAWGLLVTFVTSKAFRCHTLVLDNPSHHSSRHGAE